MSVTKFYNAWFCPFGQRVWIALLHKGVDFEYVEQNPYEKTAEWLAINPRGLVPVIVHNGRSIYESVVCLEYVDEAWPSEHNLLPKDPYQRARVRLASDHITKKIVPPFYGMLMKKTQEEREDCKKEILEGVSQVCDEMSDDGPFFTGCQFGMVDIMLAPFAQRFEVVLKPYRDFDIPNSERYERYHRWWKAVQEVPSFKATVQDPERMESIYGRYADGTAASKVGDAIREGKVLP